mgnify:FL=1
MKAICWNFSAMGLSFHLSRIPITGFAHKAEGQGSPLYDILHQEKSNAFSYDIW